jgi:hypothetical protein
LAAVQARSARPCARNASASSAASPTPPPGTPDARACGSPLLPSGAATRAAADTRSAASVVPVPPASRAALHPTAGSDTGNWTPPRSSVRTHAAG